MPGPDDKKAPDSDLDEDWDDDEEDLDEDDLDEDDLDEDEDLDGDEEPDSVA